MPKPVQPTKRAKPTSGSEARQKALFIRARVSPEEKAAVLATAEKAGLTEGAFVRVQCLAEPKTRAAKRPTVETKTLARLLGELGKVGSNVNQIARVANSDKRIVAAEAEATLAEVRRLVAAILQAMGRKGGA